MFKMIICIGCSKITQTKVTSHFGGWCWFSFQNSSLHMLYTIYNAPLSSEMQVLINFVKDILRKRIWQSLLLLNFFSLNFFACWKRPRIAGCAAGYIPRLHEDHVILKKKPYQSPETHLGHFCKISHKIQL